MTKCLQLCRRGGGGGDGCFLIFAFFSIFAIEAKQPFETAQRDTACMHKQANRVFEPCLPTGAQEDTLPASCSAWARLLRCQPWCGAGCRAARGGRGRRWELPLETSPNPGKQATRHCAGAVRCSGWWRWKKNYFSAMNITWDAAASNGLRAACPAVLGGGSPQSPSPALSAPLTSQRRCALPLLFFPPLGFSFPFAFFFPLFSLFFFFPFVSLALSPFLLCHNQTKLDTREQLLALWDAGVQQYHGLTLLAGTQPFPGEGAALMPVSAWEGAWPVSRCNIRALWRYELLVWRLLASINTLRFCHSKIPRLVTRAGALPNAVSVKGFMETSLVSVHVCSESQAYLLWAMQ